MRYRSIYILAILFLQILNGGVVATNIEFILGGDVGRVEQNLLWILSGLIVINVLTLICIALIAASILKYNALIKTFDKNPKLRFGDLAEFKGFFTRCAKLTFPGSVERKYVVEKLCKHCIQFKIKQIIFASTHEKIFSQQDLKVFREYLFEKYNPPPSDCLPVLKGGNYPTEDALEQIANGIEEYYIIFGPDAKVHSIMPLVLNIIELDLKKDLSTEEKYNILTAEVKSKKYILDIQKNEIEDRMKGDLTKRKT